MKVFDFIKDKIKLNKNPRKRLLLKQTSLLCAIVFMLVCVVWAWFTTNSKEAEASGLSISMGASDSMMISLDGGTSFHESINLLADADQDKIDETNKIKGKLSMQDITSDGMTFYRPKFTETDGRRIPNTDENWDYAAKNTAYISQEVIFRTTKPSNIYMGAGTSITTSCEIEGKALASAVVSEIGNKSKSGNFSCDCIVGALRISAVVGNNCKFVCIPRSDIELVRNGDEITMNIGSAVSDETAIHTYYSSSYMTSGTTESSFDAITGFDGSQLITTTTKTTDENGNTVYEGTATINLWLEGCDPEVTRILSGGKYRIAFEFIGVEVN